MKKKQPMPKKIEKKEHKKEPGISKINKRRILYLICVLAAFIILAGIILYLKSVSVSFPNTLEKMNILDEKYGLDWDDWQYGFDYLWYHPRYPNPLNVEDIEAALSKFEKLKDEVKSNRPSLLMVDARIHLLTAEKYMRITKSKPGRNFVENGFSCSDQPYVLEAVKNLNTSIFHGKIAVSELSELYESYKDDAKSIDISPFYIKSLNESFSTLAEQGAMNERTINRYCLGAKLKENIKIINGSIVFENKGNETA